MGPADISHLQNRLTLDASLMIGGMVLAYVCFIYLFISEGRRYFGVHAEMELASDIHRVLVPRIETTIGSFEFYGRSLPSGQVGAATSSMLCRARTDGSPTSTRFWNTASRQVC